MCWEPRLNTLSDKSHLHNYHTIHGCKQYCETNQATPGVWCFNSPECFKWWLATGGCFVLLSNESSGISSLWILKLCLRWLMAFTHDSLPTMTHYFASLTTSHPMISTLQAELDGASLAELIVERWGNRGTLPWPLIQVSTICCRTQLPGQEQVFCPPLKTVCWTTVSCR